MGLLRVVGMRYVDAADGHVAEPGAGVFAVRWLERPHELVLGRRVLAKPLQPREIGPIRGFRHVAGVISRQQLVHVRCTPERAGRLVAKAHRLVHAVEDPDGGVEHVEDLELVHGVDVLPAAGEEPGLAESRGVVLLSGGRWLRLGRRRRCHAGGDGRGRASPSFVGHGRGAVVAVGRGGDRAPLQPRGLSALVPLGEVGVLVAFGWSSAVHVSVAGSVASFATAVVGAAGGLRLVVGSDAIVRAAAVSGRCWRCHGLHRGGVRAQRCCAPGRACRRHC
mmetsp:Transcript_17749/g.50280  ORF Transcript_17749/g.50280 Transcript_17749/m.50280 type:complete len:279 (+) Transcript_17749:2305-3141(+)